MNGEALVKLLYLRASGSRPFQVSVKGFSMNPLLYEGDVVTITPTQSCLVGDIVVFFYSDGSFLIHRIVKISGGRYICKGDNCYRLEEVEAKDVIGKVTGAKRSGKDIPIAYSPAKTRLLCRMSYRIGVHFPKVGYSYDKIHRKVIYKLYAALFLKRCRKGDEDGCTN